jgi:hypothetical protein
LAVHTRQTATQVSAVCTGPRDHAVVTTPAGEPIVAAVAATEDVLGRLVDRDWSVPAGGLEWTCAQTAVHAANCLAKYAAQLAGRVEGGYLKFRLVAAPDEAPAEILRMLGSAGRLLAAAVDGAPDDARAWHWGMTDRSGFAAMGIGELLVHTYDIAWGLCVDWRPPAALAGAVLARLMPAVAHDDTAAALLAATGRIALAGQPPAGDWVWRPAAPGPERG